MTSWTPDPAPESTSTARTATGGTGGPTVPPRDVLVVGAGLAATQTVAALRERGFDGRVVVLGREGVAPYDRPPLSKHLLDRTGPTWLTDEVGADLTTLADEVHLARPARALRVSGGRPAVATDDGDVEADALVLATGARAVVPAGWQAALTLHTWADAEALRRAVGAGRRLVVVGAGWIGAEVAGVVAAAGGEVTVVEAATTPLSAALGAHVGALTVPWYAAADVRLLTGAQVAEVRPDRVRLADGTELVADAVLAAVGARPATDWLGDALPREVDGALRVDETLAVVGAPRHVRAVGDVTLRRSTRHGWVPGGHWDGALRTPAVLAADLLGAPGPVEDPAPYVFSTQLGHELALFGLPAAHDDVELRGDPADGGGWTALWFRPGTGTCSAVLTVDRPRDVGAARRLFGGASLPVLDRETARDAGRGLREAALV